MAKSPVAFTAKSVGEPHRRFARYLSFGNATRQLRLNQASEAEEEPMSLQSSSIAQRGKLKANNERGGLASNQSIRSGYGSLNPE